MKIMEENMFLRCIVFMAFSTLAVSAYGETFETIRQQFEIYRRFTGEIEILAADDTKEIDNVLKRTETKRQTVRKELDTLNETTPKRDLPSPLFAEDYAAPFLHYIAVERALAQRSLQQGKPDEMMQSIRYVYRLTDELAESGSLELRIVAVLTRLQMLEIVQSLLLHPLCRREHHDVLYKLFDDQLNHRVTDTVIWTRYREEGKQFFEELPRRSLDKMVSPNLLKELTDRRALEEYIKAMDSRFKHDQSVFLLVFKAVVESCSAPFFKRQPILRALDRELRETATEPVFAVLLLRDVSQTMRLFAQERSGIETAYLALSVATGKRSRQKTLNFLTGNEYELILITDGVMCTYEGNIKPFYVPYR
jgi:hypothetical protein